MTIAASSLTTPPLTPASARFGRLATAQEVEKIFKPLVAKHFPGETAQHGLAHTYQRSTIPLIGPIINFLKETFHAMGVLWQVRTPSSPVVYVLEGNVKNIENRMAGQQRMAARVKDDLNVQVAQAGEDQILLRFHHSARAAEQGAVKEAGVQSVPA